MEKPHNIRYIKCCENYPAHIIPLSASPKCNNFLKHKRNFSPSLFFVKWEYLVCALILHSKLEAVRSLYLSFYFIFVRQWGWWLVGWTQSSEISAPRIPGSSSLGSNGGKPSLWCPDKMKIQTTDLKNQKIQFLGSSVHIFC